MHGSSKKLARSNSQRPLSFPEGRQVIGSVTHGGHSPDVTYDASRTRSADSTPSAVPLSSVHRLYDASRTRSGESAPIASPVSPSPSYHAFTWPTNVSTNAQKPSLAPQLSLVSTRNQPAADVPSEERSCQRSVEPLPAVSDTSRSDSSAGYFVPETRLFTVCKQATFPPPIESQEVEPLPLVVRPNARPTEEGHSEAESSASGTIARTCVFAMSFPVTKQRPNVAPSTAKALRRTSTSEHPAQALAAQKSIAQQHTAEVPIREPTTGSTPRSVESTRLLLEHFNVNNKELAAQHNKETHDVPIASTANARSPSSNSQSHLLKFATRRRQLRVHLQDSAYVCKPSVAVDKVSTLKHSHNAASGNITLTDMAESFKGKNWMRQLEASSRAPDSQRQPQAVEEEQQEDDIRVSFILLWPVPVNSKKLTCSSPSCIRNTLYLDNLLPWEEERPCNDFYSFVCSRWTSQFAASSFFTDDVSTDDDYAVYLERRLHKLIRDSRGPMSDLHAKCMNHKLIDDEGWEPLLQLMYHVSLEGFPLTPPIRKTISAWKTAGKLVRKTGTLALLSVGVASHPTEAAKDVVSVGPPEMLTSGAVHLDINQAISLYTSSVFSAKRALSKQFVPPVYATDVVRFATSIEKLGEGRPHTAGDAKMDVASEQSPYLEFLMEVFAGSKASIFSGEGTDILIESPRIVVNIIKLVTSEQAHTVLNYLCVRLMIQTSALIPESDLTNFYATLVYGKRRSAMNRWEVCVRVVDKALFPLVAASLLAELRTPVAKYVDLARDIKAAFQRSADASPYLDVASKGSVSNLLAGTDMRVFSPQWVSESNLVDAYERSLPAIKEDTSALETFIALHEYTFMDSLARGSAQRWRRSAFALDCWYEAHPNTVYVPLLVFSVTEDFAEGTSPLQIPRAGPRVGKCLFDTLMSNLSVDVALDDVAEKQGDSWLTAPTRAMLQDVESCLAGVPASVATGFDRFRDALAIRAAYAHFRAKAGNLSLRLKNRHVLTEDQLFFVIAVLQACRKSAGRELRTEEGQGWLAALRNSNDFSASYNCSSDDPMNPDHKCVR
ncbi:hypothetical protein HPB50_007360 [Hyalomma asiaticum]|uniref:Uncharacterized protein n=1 Tax=Hyalomma asiaticum TaxID=266040 RepID=A0ACB7STK6_HYAAI|nr:hypothetical protein HPB50_007360 [Hyalomma asiaticum]